MLNPRIRTLLAILIVAGAPQPSIAQTAKRGPAPAQAAPAPPPNPFAGFWLDHTGDGVVELAACGADQADRLCGRIIWLRAPLDQNGRPFVDGLNEDAAQRNRPICGLPVLGNLTAKPNGTYDDGWIYDPRQGKAFNVELSLLGPDRIQVMGYKGVKLLNRKYVWTKLDTPPPRCTVPARL
jgi:uncharacterized protein (DUF2147 family)